MRTSKPADEPTPVAGHETTAVALTWSLALLSAYPRARQRLEDEAAVGALEDLAASAGYRVESSGHLPLLRYVSAVRP